MTNSEARKRMQAQNPAESAAPIDGSPSPASVDPATIPGPYAANLGDGANGRLSEAEEHDAGNEAVTDVPLLLAALDEARAQVERLHFDLDREAHARQAAEREVVLLREGVDERARVIRVLDARVVEIAEVAESRGYAVQEQRDRAEAAESALAAVRADAFSEDAQAVLFGVTGTHPETYGGVTKDEALECAGEVLTRIRATLATSVWDHLRTHGGYVYDAKGNLIGTVNPDTVTPAPTTPEETQP